MAHQIVRPVLRSVARSLRSRQTDAEERLWHELRGRRLDGLKFRRQVPIGPFIVDFACFEARLVVEVDGSQHAGNEADRARDAELASRGFRVLRFWNHEILGDIDDVCQKIFRIARERTADPRSAPTPHPPPSAAPSPTRGEGEKSELSGASRQTSQDTGPTHAP